jgi:hypothetical protein
MDFGVVQPFGDVFDLVEVDVNSIKLVDDGLYRRLKPWQSWWVRAYRGDSCVCGIKLVWQCFRARIFCLPSTLTLLVLFPFFKNM